MSLPSSANGDNLPSIPEQFRRAFPCPRCDGWMKTFHNPSYGVGLAKHHYLRLCQKCSYFSFIPEELVKSHQRTQRRDVTKKADTPTPKSRFGWRSK
ncbi:MAG TPA: hypothetical protein VN619_10890 [Lacisediminihabitans sp.]|jgi:hypothetical protein|nr:hypothetical protein [Lacisediminihabitans sp.]HXD62416.1 hypothetical protein [Lacisediminihabitans sp.]